MKSLDNTHRKYSISSIGNSEADRIEFMIDNMHLNIKSKVKFTDHLKEDVAILGQIKVYLAGLKKGYFAKLKLYLRTHFDYFV